MDGNANFGIIADFLVLTPILFLLRAILPRAETVQVSFVLVGMYAIYSVAPRFLPFYLGFWILIYLLQWVMVSATRFKGTAGNILTTAAILLVLSPLVLWKLYPAPFVNWFTETFALVIHGALPSVISLDSIAAVAAPIGLSFAVFRALDLLIKVRLGLLNPTSLLETLYFGFFAPVLAVGPVIEYEEVRFKGRVLSRLPAPGDIAVGLFRVGLGMIKVMVIATLLGVLADNLWNAGEAQFIAAWAAVLVYGLFFYINFSGYSDLAIGVSRIHGLTLKENFNNPFFKTNPQGFWNAWHMSLTRWCQRYIFVPLGGMRAKNQYFAIFMTMMVIAFWHDISWTMLMFGTYHGLIIVGHRWFENRRVKARRKLSKHPAAKWAKYFTVFAYNSFSFPLLALPIDQVLPFYGSLLPF